MSNKLNLSDINKLLSNPLLKGLDLSFEGLPTLPNYSVPTRTFIFYHFLGVPPVGTVLQHHYLPLVKNYSYLRGTDVVHGHDKDRVCAAPHFCHLFGWKPDTTSHPSFIAAFKSKWASLYD